MSRPPRPLASDVLYHVTARGNRKANIYLDDRDYLVWHDLVARTADRFGFICHAYCQMPNHFHMLVETPVPNLSEGMHFLNCVYSQNFNRRTWFGQAPCPARGLRQASAATSHRRSAARRPAQPGSDRRAFQGINEDGTKKTRSRSCALSKRKKCPPGS